jgi:hypothetical protein
MPLQGQSRAKLTFWKVTGKTGHQKQKTGYAKQFGVVSFLLHAVHSSFLFKENALLALNYIGVIVCFTTAFTPRVVKKNHYSGIQE